MKRDDCRDVGVSEDFDQMRPWSDVGSDHRWDRYIPIEQYESLRIATLEFMLAVEGMVPCSAARYDQLREKVKGFLL